jgi:hypothetical protein
MKAGTVRTALAVSGIVAFAGCADDRGVIGPPGDGPFSPQTIAGSIFSLRFAPDNIAAVQVETIAGALGLTTAGGSIAPRASGRGERGKVARTSLTPALRTSGVIGIVANQAARRANGTSVPLFPINFLGRTFVYDAGLEAYVLDASLGGAPANGVRFLLYTLETGGVLPALPLFPIGFVDLIDQSDATSTRIRVRAVDTTGSGNVALADYYVDGAFGSVSSGILVNLIAEGFMADRNGRFDFRLDEILETDDLAAVTFVSIVHDVVSDEGTDVRLEVEGDLANDGSHAALDYVMTIRGAGGRTVVDLGIVDDVQDGTITHNGAVEALVAGTVLQPDFTPTRGGGFSFDELTALDEILFGIDDILLTADVVYAPLGELFGVR